MRVTLKPSVFCFRINNTLRLETMAGAIEFPANSYILIDRHGTIARLDARFAEAFLQADATHESSHCEHINSCALAVNPNWGSINYCQRCNDVYVVSFNQEHAAVNATMERLFGGSDG